MHIDGTSAVVLVVLHEKKESKREYHIASLRMQIVRYKKTSFLGLISIQFVVHELITI